MVQRIIIVLFALTLLSACVTSATVLQDAELSPEHGLVVVRLSSNSPGFGFFTYWHALTVKRIDGDFASEYGIGLSRKGNARSAVYLGSLPPGRYELAGLSSEQCGAICVSSSLTIPDSFGDFEVERGRTTDLGHLIYEQAGRKQARIFRGKTTRSWIPEYIEHYYDNIPASAVLEPYLEWNDLSGDARIIQSTYDDVRQRSGGLFRAIETENGSVLFGSFLGILKHWVPGLGIERYDTGMQGAVESVVEVTPGTWLAGGENGQIRISRDAGETWSDFGDGFPFRSLAGLHSYNAKIYATVNTEESLGIYQATIDDPSWTQVSVHSLKYAFWTGVPVFPTSLLYENYLVTSLPTNGLLITDLETLETTTKEFPGSISSFHVGLDGVIRCTCSRVMWFYPWMSSDLGDTWVPSGHERLMSMPYFTNEKTGYSVLDGELRKTSDGGVEWQKVGAFPKIAPHLGHIQKTGDLYATDSYSLIYRSTDKGKTWQRE